MKRKRRSDAGVKRPSIGTPAERQLQAEKREAAYIDRERRSLRRWSDDRLRRLIASVEAGNCDRSEGWEDKPLADVFELRFIADEAQRRGWSPLRIPERG